MNFTDMLKNDSWDDTFLQEDINKSFNQFLNNFYISFELCFPMQHVTTSTNLKNNHWLTKEYLVNGRRASLFSAVIEITP